VLEPLGAGGMGEVYRARDVRLDRDVALKLLPEEFFADPERRARFEREAKLLATLNHPGIASIHAFEEADGRHLLAMELVGGETLDARLALGPLPLDETLPIASQIAEALEAAHERGIVHRDLKPANVMIASDGRVKILDFGLAKALEENRAGSSNGLTHSHTLTARATGAGMILGTAAYMSPEQARGRTVDRRTDIWAFGCVLFECLTGRKAFEGETVSDTLAAILTRDPEYALLPETTPPLVRRVLKRCLERDARLRLHDVADARLDLLEAAAPAASAALSTPALSAIAEATASHPSPRFSRFLPWLLAALFAVAAAAALLSRKPSAPAAPVLRGRVLLAGEGELMESTGAAVVVSPDGSRLAFVMHRPQSRLYVRPLDRLESIEIPESDGAENPAFSPDGEWISFFSAGKLRRVPVTGGTPTTICAAPTARGATWITPDTILLAPKTAGGLALVSANGGEPRPVTTPNAAAGERTHRWPSALPGGKIALFMTQLAGADYDDGIIEAVEIASGKRTVLHRGGAFPRYVPSGHLLFVRKGTLFAVTMDPSKPALTGRPVPVMENVMSSTGAEAPSDGSAQIDVAPSGLAVYRTGQPETMYRLALLDRKGTEIHTIGSPRGYARPRISPDGTRIAVVAGGQSTGDIWVYDVAREAFQRLTFEGNSWSPAWTPDSRSVAYSSDRGQKVQDAQGGGMETVRGVYVRRADGTGAERFLLKTTGLIAPTGFSADGRMLVFDQSRSQTQADVAVIHLSESGDVVGEPELLVASPRIDSNGAFSYDGKWLAYEVGDGGNPRIYLRAAAGGDSKWQVSEELGSNARWSRDGKLHFLKADGTVTAISVGENAGAPVFGKEERLFVISSLQSGSGALALNGWDMSADGTRFVALKREVAANGIDANHVVLVSDFLQELRRLAPSAPR